MCGRPRGLMSSPPSRVFSVYPSRPLSAKPKVALAWRNRGQGAPVSTLCALRAARDPRGIVSGFASKLRAGMRDFAGFRHSAPWRGLLLFPDGASLTTACAPHFEQDQGKNVNTPLFRKAMQSDPSKMIGSQGRKLPCGNPPNRAGSENICRIRIWKSWCPRWDSNPHTVSSGGF